MSEFKSSTSPLICLTGGIATGKTSVASWFAARNWAVICTDEIVHRLYEPDQDLPREIAHEFGPTVITPEGRVNRSELAKIVFKEKGTLQRLMGLVHPKVRAVWKKQAAEAVYCGKKTMIIIPLAYETQIEKEFQQVWVVACSDQEQKNRLYQRGLNEAQIKQRLSSQWPLQKKMDLADLVIWNNGPWSLTEEQLGKILTA